MKKLSIALLFASIHMSQAYVLQDFVTAANKAEANRSEENIENVLRILDDLTDPSKRNARKISSAQIQRLQRLGLGDYAQSTNRLDLYRSRNTRGPVAGAPGAPAGIPAPSAEVAAIEIEEIDPDFIEAASKILQLDIRRNALASAVKDLKNQGGVDQALKNKISRKIDKLDQELMNTADLVRKESTSGDNSSVVQEDYKGLAKKIADVTKSVNQLKIDAKGIKVLTDEAKAEQALKDALIKNAEDNKVDISDVEDFVEQKVSLSEAFEEFLFDRLIAEVEKKKLDEEMAKTSRAWDSANQALDNANAAIERAKSEAEIRRAQAEAKRLANQARLAATAEQQAREAAERAQESKKALLLQSANILYPILQEYKQDLEEYKGKVSDDSDFNTAYAEFNSAYQRFFTQKDNERLTEDERKALYTAPIEAYNKAAQAYKKYFEDKEGILEQFRSYDQSLAEYLAEMKASKVDTTSFEAAKKAFERIYTRLIGKPTDRALVQQANDAYQAALKLYKPAGSASGVTNTQQEKKFYRLQNELNFYLKAIAMVRAEQEFRNLQNDPLNRKDNITNLRNQLSDIVVQLNTVAEKNGLKKLSPTELEEIVDQTSQETRTIIRNMNSQFNALSAENNIPKDKNLVNALKKAFTLPAGDIGDVVIEWPQIILAPEEPKAPEVKPGNGGSRPGSVKSPKELYIQDYSARITNAAQAEAAIDELMEEKYSEKGVDEAKIDALREVASKIPGVDQAALTAL